MGVADFWLWPRSDGSYLVTSPLLESVMPTKPTIAVSNVKGAPEIYTIAADGRQLSIGALGANARETGGVAVLEQELAQRGNVTKTERTDGAQHVTILSVPDPKGTFRAETRADLARGLVITATAMTTDATRVADDRFVASVHLREALDALADPTTLTGVRVRKAGKKLVMHDKTDAFTIEIPWPGKITHTVDAKARRVDVTMTASNKKSKVVITISEMTAWDALAVTPAELERTVAGFKTFVDQQSAQTTAAAETLGGLPATRLDPGVHAKSKIQAHLVWNSYQHRLYQIFCTDTPCDAIVKSMHFADPTPAP